MKRQRNALKLLDAQTLARLAGESLRRLHPRRLAHNPVMFVVGVGTLVTLWLTGTDIIAGRPWGFDLAIHLDTAVHPALCQRRRGTGGGAGPGAGREPALHTETARGPARSGDAEEQVPATALRRGDRVRILAGELIPADGEVIEGDRQRRRVGDHRRVGAGHPRGRRRPQRRHRRHASVLSDQHRGRSDGRSRASRSSTA
ncbi:MAG: hypothetical protein MZV65_20650 [Chromatiales bacterium]|nr:hypothetical protein [Chromatiales bacterium]